MNIEKMLNSLTPEKLEMGLAKLQGVLSEDQMKQVKQALSDPNRKNLQNQLKNVDMDKVKNNPDFKKFFPNK